MKTEGLVMLPVEVDVDRIRSDLFNFPFVAVNAVDQNFFMLAHQHENRLFFD